MKIVGAGEMRERVSIQSATVTYDDFNAEVLTWATTTTVWAKITERGGREPILADRPVMVISYEVTIRDNVTATNLMRLIWGDKTLAIETVTPDRAAGLIRLRCLEAE